MRCALFAGLALVLSACQDSLPTAPVASAVPLAGFGAPSDKFVQRVPIDIVVAGFCIAEPLVVKGTLNVVTTVWANADRLRIHSHLNGNLAAIGQYSGLSYRYQQVSNTDYEQETSTAASESEQVYLFRVTSSTAAPDFHVQLNGTQYFDPLLGSTFVAKRWEVLCR